MQADHPVGGIDEQRNEQPDAGASSSNEAHRRRSASRRRAGSRRARCTSPRGRWRRVPTATRCAGAGRRSRARGSSCGRTASPRAAGRRRTWAASSVRRSASTSSRVITATARQTRAGEQRRELAVGRHRGGRMRDSLLFQAPRERGREATGLTDDQDLGSPHHRGRHQPGRRRQFPHGGSAPDTGRGGQGGAVAPPEAVVPVAIRPSGIGFRASALATRAEPWPALSPGAFSLAPAASRPRAPGLRDCRRDVRLRARVHAAGLPRRVVRQRHEAAAGPARGSYSSCTR